MEESLRGGRRGDKGPRLTVEEELILHLLARPGGKAPLLQPGGVELAGVLVRPH